MITKLVTYFTTLSLLLNINAVVSACYNGHIELWKLLRAC